MSKVLSFYIVSLILVQPFNSSGQDMKAVREVIDTLSSPSMHGRGYVENGDRIAAEYIRQSFEEIGLKSFKETHFQNFTLDINTFPKNIKLRIGKKTLTLGSDYIVNSISKGGKGKGKLIRLDTAIYNDNAAKTKFADQKMKNMILWYPQNEYQRIIELPQFVIDKIYESEAIIEVKSQKLTASLSQRQLSNPFYEVLDSIFDSTLRQIKNRKIKVKYKLDAELLSKYESQNVIGYLSGTVQPDSFLVVSAHYDHLGHLGKDVYFPGANDNASGVALLLELAKHYQKTENRLPYSMVFMAFGGEEVGLLGSLHYVKNPLFPLRNIKFMLNFDLVGTGDDGLTVVNGSVFEQAFQKLVQINELNKYIPEIKRRGIAANSDHYFFTESGVPSFFIYTLGGITAYHDIYDTAENLPLTKFEGLFHLVKDFMSQWQLEMK